MDNGPERTYSVEEVSSALGIGQDKTRRFIKTGQLTAINVGARERPRWRVSESAFRQFIANRQSTSK